MYQLVFTLDTNPDHPRFDEYEAYQPIVQSIQYDGMLFLKSWKYRGEYLQALID